MWRARCIIALILVLALSCAGSALVGPAVAQGCGPPMVPCGGSGGSNSGLTLATSNLSFFAATTGNDNNSCTASGSPCLHVQSAINKSAAYNYQNKYFPTVNVATGTYNEQIVLPALVGSYNPATGLAAGLLAGVSVKPIIADTGTDVPIRMAQYSNWQISLLSTQGTVGGIYVATGAILGITDNIDLGAESGLTATNYLLDNETGFVSLTAGKTIFVSQNAKGFSFNRGQNIFNGGTIAILGALSFSSSGSYFAGDSVTSFYGLIGTNLILTSFGGSITSGGGLGLTSGAFVECSIPSGTTVDSAALTSLNFPGHGTNDANNWIVDSTNQCDNVSTVSVPAATGTTVTMADGQLNQVLNPSGNVTSLTVKLPAVNSSVPWSHQVTISNSSANSITGLTISALDGKTVNGGPTSLATKTSVRFQFDATTSQWYVQ